MRAGERRLTRTARLLLIVALLALNGWLVLLNLEKRGWSPFDADVESGAAGEGGGDLAGGGDGSAGGSDAGVDLLGPEVDASLLRADGQVPGRTGTVEVDDWPGGRGPEPVGPPVPRQVLLRADGTALIVGSAPRWSVVEELVDRVGRRLPGGPARVETELTWHPDAPDDAGVGVARVERSLQYAAGEVGLPPDGIEILEPVVGLLAARPDLYAVVVAHIDDLGESEQNAAVALARAVAVVERLADRGIDRSRLVTIVAPTDPDAPTGADETTRRFNRRVEVRFENLLNPPSAG